MYICVCNALNEKTLRQAAQKIDGKVSAAKVYKSLGVRPQCGKCLPDAQDFCCQAQNSVR